MRIPCPRGSDPRARGLHVDVDQSYVDVRIHVRVGLTHVSVSFTWTWIGVVWTRENPCARGWDPRERGFHVVGIHRPSHTVRDNRIRYVTIASYTVRAIRCVTIESNTVRAIRYVTIAYGT